MTAGAGAGAALPDHPLRPHRPARPREPGLGAPLAAPRHRRPWPARAPPPPAPSWPSGWACWWSSPCLWSSAGLTQEARGRAAEGMHPSAFLIDIQPAAVAGRPADPPDDRATAGPVGAGGHGPASRRSTAAPVEDLTRQPPPAARLPERGRTAGTDQRGQAAAIRGGGGRRWALTREQRLTYMHRICRRTTRSSSRPALLGRSASAPR